MCKTINMVGAYFGGLTAIRRTGACSSGDAKWLFKCACGADFEANGYSVRSGRITSCPGCARARSAEASRKHGRSDTPEFRIWTGIHTRCFNKNASAYENYGGRGIGICQRWQDFSAFLADIGPRPSPAHSIDRLDNDGDYTPGNCRWATAREQVLNRRNSARVAIRGITKPLVEWCEEYSCTPAAAYARMAHGLQGEAIFRSTVQTLEFQGVVDTIAGWSKRTGIKASTITMRVRKYGWPVDKALTKGASRCA